MEITRSLFASRVLNWMDTSSFTVCKTALGRNRRDGALVSHRNADIIYDLKVCLAPYIFHPICFPAIPENVCTKPTVPDGMTIYPDKMEIQVGSDIMLACSEWHESLRASILHVWEESGLGAKHPTRHTLQDWYFHRINELLYNISYHSHL